MTIIELKLSTAIKEAGDIEDVRLRKEDAEYIQGLLKKADDALILLKEQETIVRCKDCKHRPRPKEPNFETYESGFDLEFPEGSKCPCRCCGDEWYSWYPEDDWFCGWGEKKNDDA